MEGPLCNFDQFWWFFILTNFEDFSSASYYNCSFFKFKKSYCTYNENKIAKFVYCAKCGKRRLRRRLWRHKKEIIQEDLWCHNIKLWLEFEIEHIPLFFKNTMWILNMYVNKYKCITVVTIFRCIFISKQQALDTGYTYTEYIRTVSGSSPPNHRKGKLLSKREVFFCNTIPFWITQVSCFLKEG